MVCSFAIGNEDPSIHRLTDIATPQEACQSPLGYGFLRSLPGLSQMAQLNSKGELRCCLRYRTTDNCGINPTYFPHSRFASSLRPWTMDAFGYSPIGRRRQEVRSSYRYCIRTGYGVGTRGTKYFILARHHHHHQLQCGAVSSRDRTRNKSWEQMFLRVRVGHFKVRGVNNAYPDHFLHQ